MCDMWEPCPEGAGNDSEADEVLLREFSDSIEFVDGRYRVRIPWRECKDQLMDNREEVERRQVSQERMVASKPLSAGCL